MADRRKKQEDVFIELVNLQLKPHGKSFADVKGDPEWYMKYQTTRDTEKDFMVKGSELIRKKLGLNKTLAESEMSWFVLQWGLTTKDPYIKVQKKEKTTRKNAKN